MWTQIRAEIMVVTYKSKYPTGLTFGCQDLILICNKAPLAAFTICRGPKIGAN